MVEHRRRTQGERPIVAILAGLLAAMVVPVSAGAVDGPLDPVDTVEFVEVAPPSPLSPGIDTQRHLPGGLPLPIAAPGGFAHVDFDGSLATVSEVSPTGTVSTSEITADVSLEGGDFTRALQLTDDYLLAEFVVLDGDSEILGSQPVRIDRSSGETLVLFAGGDTAGKARLSADGRMIAVSASVGPFWALIADGAPSDVGGSFQNGDFISSQAVPSMSPDERFVAVTGGESIGEDDLVRELRAVDTTGVLEDLSIDLPCPVTNCEHEIGAVTSRSGGGRSSSRRTRWKCL